MGGEAWNVHEVWLTHSADEGATWGEPVRADDGTVMRTACSTVGLAATADGHVTVAKFAGGPAAGAVRTGILSAAAGTYLWWVAREIGAETGAGWLRVTRSRDGGATFDPPASWSPANIPPRPNNPVLVADSNGAVHMFLGLSTTDTAFGYLQRPRSCRSSG